MHGSWCYEDKLLNQQCLTTLLAYNITESIVIPDSVGWIIIPVSMFFFYLILFLTSWSYRQDYSAVILSHTRENKYAV